MECRHQVALFTPGELKSVTFIQQQRGYKLEHMIHYYQPWGGGAQAKQNPEARQSGRHEGLSPHAGLLVVKETDSIPLSEGQPGLQHALAPSSTTTKSIQTGKSKQQSAFHKPHRHATKHHERGDWAGEQAPAGFRVSCLNWQVLFCSRKDDRASVPREKVDGSRKAKAAMTCVCPPDTSAEDKPRHTWPPAGGHGTASSPKPAMVTKIELL